MSSNQECGGSIDPIAEFIDQTTASIIETGVGPGSQIEAQLAERDGNAFGFARFTSFTRAMTAGSASL
jgi:hypothetical protein